jgi:hypothetical protein
MLDASTYPSPHEDHLEVITAWLTRILQQSRLYSRAQCAVAVAASVLPSATSAYRAKGQGEA